MSFCSTQPTSKSFCDRRYVMRDDLRKRLRELGVVRGVAQLSAPAGVSKSAIEKLVPGHFHTTTNGQCFVAEEKHPLEHLHGDLPLLSFLSLTTEEIVSAGQDPALADIDRERYCFLDTETTGLSGGTGTMAFVVGIGFFRRESFVLHQYFLRDPGDEPAMIEALAEELAEFEVIVSFNGRAFDVPILETRFILARRPPATSNALHLDLLHPARRLWRYRLHSCALGVLEQEVLGVEREQADVPGGLIPWLYRDYLRTGDAREMKRVIYHNAIDILSLVTLTARLGRVLTDPWAEPSLSAGEYYALARWYDRVGRTEETERAYRSALLAAASADPGEDGPERTGAGATGLDVRAAALRGLAYHLKRSGRRDEAYIYWQQLAADSTSDVDHRQLARVEVAKYLEWHVTDYALAAEWTQAAIASLEQLGAGPRQEAALGELRHRLARLQRKAEAACSGEDASGAATDQDGECDA
ncbi:MAG: hypothetical protein E3J64_10305 [Anaerolineales bacterium]|nr:MAG: hypothetical protein E3J64_10305 [Anaerolineales bacterium]